MPEMTYTPSFLIRASFFRYFVNTLAVGVSRLRGRYTTLSAKPTEGRMKRALRAEQPLYSASQLWYNVGKSFLRMEGLAWKADTAGNGRYFGFLLPC